MKIATWNINSVRLRLPLLAKLVKEHTPDIIALQETKVADELFPFDGIRTLGYPHIEVAGQKGYHGVAILSKLPLVKPGKLKLLEGDQARHVSVQLPDGTELHNFYVPAGGDIPDRVENPYFGFKLDYVEAMGKWFAENRKHSDRMIIVGDFNVAPLENDVWSHKQLLKIVSHTPDEVERLEALRASVRWHDAARHFVPHSEKLYSWWSYRNQDWRKSDRGRRLDHIWLTDPLLKSLKSVETLKDARDWIKASDHVPVMARFAA